MLQQVTIICYDLMQFIERFLLIQQRMALSNNNVQSLGP